MKTFNIDFYKNKKIFFIISIAVIVIGLICNVIFGAQLDIQFAGGAMIKYSVDGDVDSNEIDSLVEKATGRSVSVATSEIFGSSDKQITVSFAGNKGVTLDEQHMIAEELSAAYADRTFSVVESSSVDPTMGAKFFQKCLVCLLITFVLLLGYIALRFRKIGGLSAGVTAIIALLHDVVIVYFAFVIFGFTINDIFIAVILTILGYSLNDTIVIYDRIRENRKKLDKKVSISEIVNLSLHQSLARNIITSVCVFIAIATVTVIALITSMESILSFALPMTVGVVAGFYSSTFLCTPMWALWVEKKAAKK